MSKITLYCGCDDEGYCVRHTAQARGLCPETEKRDIGYFAEEGLHGEPAGMYECIFAPTWGGNDRASGDAVAIMNDPAKTLRKAWTGYKGEVMELWLLIAP